MYEKQTKTAEYLGISTRQYRRLEKETPESVIQFFLLAKHFKKSIDYLLQQSDDGSLSGA
jgi:transcriptional regulator with XRE-family HTH domain